MTRKTRAQLLTDFMSGINEAESAAGTIIHHHQDMRWHFIRKILEEVKDVTVRVMINPITETKITKYEKKTQLVMP